LSTTTVTSPSTAPSKSADSRWLVLIVVSIAQLMVVLDATIINIALPAAQADLGFASSERQWIITAYALAFGSLLLLGGRIGDLYGRKRTFIAGLIGFAVASAIGGAAPSFGVLVTARAFQGVAGAILAPAALSTLVTTFTDPRDRGKAFGVFGSVAVGGGAVGLILGGFLTEYLSWRWSMYVNVFFAAAAIVGALLYMKDVRPATRPRLDLLGTVLASAGLFCIVFGFSHAETASWTAGLTILTLALGVILLGCFVAAESRVSVPLLPLRVVADRARAVAFASVALSGAAMFGVFLFLTYFLQTVKLYSPVMCGIAFLPMIACIMLSSNLANIVTLPRFGPRIVITTGMVLGFLSLSLLTRLTVHSSYAGGVLPSLLLLGLAMGSVMAPSMNTATAGVRAEDSGVASALVSTMQQVGGAVGVAMLSTIAASATSAFVTNHSLSGPDAVANTHGYTVTFAVCALLYAIGAVIDATLFPSKERIAQMRAATAVTVAPELAEIAAVEI
jgi:EmrB/QacA subfamily drug resistance transporter